MGSVQLLFFYTKRGIKAHGEKNPDLNCQNLDIKGLIINQPYYFLVGNYNNNVLHAVKFKDCSALQQQFG